MNTSQLEAEMLEAIFIKTGGRPENSNIAEICAEIAMKYIPSSVPNNGNWISPVKTEAEMQEHLLKKIFDGYPDSAFKWQYLNSLLQMALSYKSSIKETENNKIMSDKDWLERATTFDLGQCIFYNRPIKIEAREQMDGSRFWVLKMHEWVLGKDGKFHYEPMPSSRTDDFIKNTRFGSPNEAHQFWIDNITKEEPLYAIENFG